MADPERSDKFQSRKHTSNGIKKHAKRGRYTPVACNECKLRKVKCSGHETCRRCMKHGVRCEYDRVQPTDGFVLATDEPESPRTESYKEEMKLELARMKASLDSLLQNVKANGLVTTMSTQEQQPAGMEAGYDQLDSCIDSSSSRRSSNAVTGGLINDFTQSLPLDDTVDGLSDLAEAVQYLQSQDLSMSFNMAQAPKVAVTQHVLWPLLEEEAFKAFNGFREELESLYPFINVQEMTALLHAAYRAPTSYRPDPEIQTADWSTLDDIRNTDLLKVIVACALATNEKKDVEIAREFASVVEEDNFKRMGGSGICIKDLAIATMLSVYHCQSDEIILAWRKIGSAARMCLELGMHKASIPSDQDPKSSRAPWVSKMFWCIYVLDRRYSFMTQLPFTFHDDDIDPKLPLPDRSSPYLLPMVTYGRLGARVMPALPKLRTTSGDLDDDKCTTFGNEIDRWAKSNNTDVISRNTYTRVSASEQHNWSLAAFCRIRANQMRLSLYKHALTSPSRIAQNLKFAQLGVYCAADNIRILSQLKADRYTCEPQAVQHNFFLISSIVVLYLAIRNAPQIFSGASHDYFAALNLLKSLSLASNASGRLQKSVQTIEEATKTLNRGSFDFISRPLSPQLNFWKDFPRIDPQRRALEDRRRSPAPNQQNYGFFDMRQCLPPNKALKNDGCGDRNLFGDLWSPSRSDCWQLPSNCSNHGAASPPAALGFEDYLVDGNCLVWGRE